MTRDLVVRLLDGTYELARELVFSASENDGGTKGLRVIYEAQPGAHPVLSAGLRVAGWQQLAGSPIWVAEVPDGFDTRQLYINGVRARRARGPVPLPIYEVPGVGFRSEYDVLSDWERPEDLEFIHEYDWKHVRCGVAAVEGKQIVMEQPCFDNATLGTAAPIGALRYIENAIELLDEPGEWYLNRDDRLLYYYPQSTEDPRQQEIFAAHLEGLVRGVGTPQAPLRNLTLRGLTFAYAGWTGPSGPDGFCEMQAHHRLTGEKAYLTQGGCQTHNPPGSCPFGDWTPTPANISFSGTDGLVLERNQFVHLGGTGLRLADHVTSARVSGNVFRDISGNGLEVGLASDTGIPVPDALPSDNVLDNNWISEVGVEYPSAVGLFQGYTRRSIIEHNQLNNLPYTGISSGWGWGFHESATLGNVIRANLVFDHVQQLIDGGGIYTQGNQGTSIETGAEVSYNYIHDQRSSAHSLYTDSGSRYMTLHHNVLFGNNLYQDLGGCFLGPPTNMGDMLVFENWWQQGPPSWDCIALAPQTFVLDQNVALGELNQAPAAIRETAGVEPAYADIRGEPAPSHNLAFRKPCQALDQAGAALPLQPGQRCGASLDGDTSSSIKPRENSSWQLQIDLLDLQDIDRVRVDLPASSRTGSMHVELSADGVTYARFASNAVVASGAHTIKLTPTAARFVRLIFSAALPIAEVGVFGRPDNALHKDAYAEYVDGSPAFMQVGSLPSLAVDGMAKTLAQATGQWRWVLRVDLGSARPIDRLIMTTPWDRFATEYSVEGSQDGLTWTTLIYVTDGQSGARALDFAASTVRHLRVVAVHPDAAWQVGGQMTIDRLSAYGAPDLAPEAAAQAQDLDGNVAATDVSGLTEYALDGNLGTAAQAQRLAPWQLKVDLGDTRTLHEVDLVMPARAYATAFHIDTSIDGLAWEGGPRVSMVGAGGQLHVPLPAARPARYLRVVADAPSGPDRTDSPMAIAELTAY